MAKSAAERAKDYRQRKGVTRHGPSQSPSRDVTELRAELARVTALMSAQEQRLQSLEDRLADGLPQFERLAPRSAPQVAGNAAMQRFLDQHPPRPPVVGDLSTVARGTLPDDVDNWDPA